MPKTCDDKSQKNVRYLFDIIKNTKTEDDYNQAEHVNLSLMEKLSLLADLTYAFLQFVTIALFLVIKSVLMFPVPKKEEDITNNLALVTGGGHGLGKELCLELARCGARVAVADINERAARDTAHLLCTMYGGGSSIAKAYLADVSDPEAVALLEEEVRKDWNRPVDILVNNAGLLAPVSLFNGEDCDINAVIDVNLKSHFWMLRKFVPAMKAANKGHIISICSMAGVLGLSRACSYSATKFGLRGLSLSLAEELKDAGVDGIKVSIAYPYFLTTRKELIDNVDLRIPPICPEVAAKQIVSGMRKNQLHIGVPSHLPYVGAVLGLMPDDVVELFRKTFYAEIKL